MTTYAQPPNGGPLDQDPLFDWSPAASPASPSRPLGSAEVRETPVGDGPGSVLSFAQYDPGTSSWRTSQTSLMTPTPSGGCSVTWPKTGSMRTGRCYRRAPWVHHIDVAACIWWPTARSTMAKVMVKIRPKRDGYGLNLEEVVAARGETGGYLNPRWIEWLMGFPAGWSSTSFTPSETQSSPKSENSSES